MNSIIKSIFKALGVCVLLFLILAVLDNKDELKGLADAVQEEEFSNPLTIEEGVRTTPVNGEHTSHATILEDGWNTPVKLPVNDEGREDSTYITRDGRYLLFYHDPTVGEFRENDEDAESVDPKIYYSERPFVTKQVHPMSTDNFNVEAGPYISENGDMYYTKTFIELFPTPHEAMPRKTKKNDEVIDMGTEKPEIDPHYCDAEGELYVSLVHEADANGIEDQDIIVMKNGITTTLPAPINIEGSSDFQPFLTDDCQTMYFTSSRESTLLIFPFHVYKSTRMGEFEWSTPELFLKFDNPELIGGVGEFGMTRDNNQMVYIELIITGNEGNNEMYHAQRSN